MRQNLKNRPIMPGHIPNTEIGLITPIGQMVKKWLFIGLFLLARGLFIDSPRKLGFSLGYLE